MSLPPQEVKHCPNCDRYHEFFFGYPSCDPSLTHGFMPLPGSFSVCKFCDKSKDDVLHDKSGRSAIKYCTNCNSEHKFVSGWPYCDAHQPHGFMTYTGMEGRCQFCGGSSDAYLHRKELRS